MQIKRHLRPFLLILFSPLVSCATENDLTTAIAIGFMGEDGGDKLFYYPTKDAPFTPKKYGYVYKDVYFDSSDGVKLHGWWLPARKEGTAGTLRARGKGTVVYSHGNAGSVAHHFVFIHWLVDAGYNVLMYDYRGYGESGGVVTKTGLVEDAGAAFRYVEGREDVVKIISLGHSLGGAKSVAALGRHAPNKLRGVVVDSTFASYQDMAETLAGARARTVVTPTFNASDYVTKLPKDVPFLVVHGDEDTTIPLDQGRKLYEAAHQPKNLWVVEGGNHVDCFFVDDGKYRGKLLKWLDAAVAK